MGRRARGHGAVEAKVKGRVLSPVWIIPLVAVALIVYLGYKVFAGRGPEITLTLTTADGLVVDQTQVKHKAVPLGTVSDITLSEDLKSARVKLRMNEGTKPILTDHARFWVVRPRISAGNLTGLETIVSGPYIEVDPGPPGGKPARAFKALDEPPGRESDEPGRVFVLHAARLGSLSVGAPLYYRDVEVGEILSYDLGDGRGPVVLRAFVREPFDRFVRARSRFWNASGLSVTTTATGLHVEVESLQSVVSGSVAFETPQTSEAEPPAAENARFELFEDRAAAEAASYRVRIPCVSYFHASVQGLARGSPVLVSGIPVGSVTDIRLVYEPSEPGLMARVAFDLQPERLLGSGSGEQESATERRAFTDASMRVVLESSDLLTGSKHLSVTYGPRKPGAVPKEGDAIVLPGSGGGLEDATAALSDVASKMDRIPFEQIGQDAEGALAGVRRLANDVDRKAGPALEMLPGIAAQLSELAKNANGTFGPNGYGPSSDFQRNLDRLIGQMNDAARSYRVLADLLDRHPEALLRGRASAGNR
jgi:paraquat-inducible protein B